MSAQTSSVRWTNELGAWVRSSPALAQDGTVYLGTSAGLYAITNNGVTASTKWIFVAAGTAGAPSIGYDGTIYCGSIDGKLYAITPDGSLLWAFQAQVAGGSAAIDFDGTIYVVGNGYLYAVTASGMLKWKSEVETSDASPIIAEDGTIYVGSRNWGYLYAFHRDGSQKWVRDVPAGSAESGALGSSGVLYAVANSLFAFSSLGSNFWWFGSFDSSPVVGIDGTIYVRGFSDHYLYAIGPNGQVTWHTSSDEFTQSAPTSPALDTAGNMYFCASNSIWLVTAQGIANLLVYGGGSPAEPPLANTSPVIGSDGTIYAALGTTLYAISGSKELANSSWPMYRQNPRHTGKIERPLMRRPRKRPDANFEFELYAQVAQTQIVQVSGDLLSWTPLTNIAITNVPMVVVDLAATNFPSRFYRAISQ